MKKNPVFVLILTAIILFVAKPAAYSLETQPPVETPEPQYAPNSIIVKFRADVAVNQAQFDSSFEGLNLSQSLAALNTNYKARQIKPLFKNFRKNLQKLKAFQKQDKILLTPKQKHILKRLKRAPKDALVPDLDRIYLLELELEEGQGLANVVKEYDRDPDVEYAELNHIYSICAEPNDPEYDQQWALPKIDAPLAWDTRTRCDDIIVAVIDTGVYYIHPDIDDNMWVNQSELHGTPGVDDDGNGYMDDIYGYDFCNNDSDPIDDAGHGTHCAGIIAAEGNNGLYVSGLCWDGRIIMAVKFLDSQGRGYTDQAVQSFYYAVENGADITSNSWGGGGYSKTLEEAIDYAHSQGVIVVAAAGNTNSDLPHYPAYLQNVFSVAATDSQNHRASFSTYGRWIDICAPGVSILSLQNGGGTTEKSGTSMACPYAAGACALTLAQYPNWNNNLIIGQVIVSANDISAAEPTLFEKGLLGSGRLNAYNALTQPPAPRLIYTGYSIDDSMGDDDLRVDPCETFYLNVQIKNTGSLTSNTHASISSNSPWIEIVDGNINLGQIEPGQKNILPQEHFVITAAPNCPAELVIPIELTICGDDGYIREDSFCIYPKIKWVFEGPDFSGPMLRRIAIDEKGAIYACEGRSIFHPSPDWRDGLYKGTTALDGKINWRRLGPSNGLPNEYYSAFDCAVAGSTVYTLIGLGGFSNAADDLLYRSTDYGETWVPILNIGEDLGDSIWVKKIISFPDDPNMVYVFAKNSGPAKVQELFLLWNGGLNWKRLCNFYPHQIVDITIDPEQPNTFYACGRYPTGTGKYMPVFCKSIDSGQTLMFQTFPQYNAQATAITITSDRIYLALENAGVLKSVDGGQTWTLSNNGLEVYTGYYYTTNSPDFYDIHVDINNPNMLYLSIRGRGQYKSFDAGQTWYPINFGSFPHSGYKIIQDQLSPHKVYVADLYSGVYSYYPNQPRLPVKNLRTGERYGHIQLATDEAQDGDQIVVSPGIYYENIDFRGKNLTVRSINPNELAVVSATVINGRNLGSAVRFSNGEDTSCVLNGFTITDGNGINGGGIYCQNSSPTLANCIIKQNSADDGAGICCLDHSSPTIVNCVFTENTADLRGGAIFSDSYFYPTVSNCTITQNSAYNGGAVYTTSRLFKITNSILWGNSAVFNSEIRGRVIVDYSNVQGGYTGTGNTNADPCFVEPSVHDYHLLPDSPCINAGDPCHPYDPNETDLDGNPRIIDGRIDMGTYEYLPPIETRLWIMPRTINRKSNQKNIMAWLRLPAGVTKDDIDENVPLTLYPGDIEASRQFIFKNNRGGKTHAFILAFFKKSDLMNAVPEDGQVQLEAVGQLNTGRYFLGQRTVRIINPPHQHPRRI